MSSPPLRKKDNKCNYHARLIWELNNMLNEVFCFENFLLKESNNTNSTVIRSKWPVFAVECWKIFLFFPLPYFRVNLKANTSALGVKYEVDKDFLLSASLCSLPRSLVQGTPPHSQGPICFLLLPFKPNLEASDKSYYTYSITLGKLKWNIFCSPASFTFSDNFYLELYNEFEAEQGKVVELAPDLGGTALLLTIHWAKVAMTVQSPQDSVNVRVSGPTFVP